MSLDCVHRWFAGQAARTPDAVAVVFGDERLTYGELDARANRLAHHLRARGVGPEVLVALCVERSAAMVVAILGILKAGGAYLPLDPTYPAERLEMMTVDSQAPVVVTEAALAGTFEGRARSIVRLDGDAAAIGAHPASAPEDASSLESLAYVIYTSGSTGKPKGTLVTHRNVARLFHATDAWFHFGPSDAWTLFHSIAFDFSVWELWGALLYGGRVVVVPYATSRSPKAFHELVRRERVTVLNQTPSAFGPFMRADEESTSGALALRLVVFGGEALNIPSLAPWFARHGDATPLLVNMYGITETTVHVTYRALTRADSAQSASVIGRPIPDLGVRILDARGQPVAAGATGELHVSGAGVCRGYLGRPALTAERFVPDPSGEPGARLYRTGDLGRLRPDGDLEYLGRIDHQVKIRGFRIELGEIESALVSTGLVRQAVVVLRDDGTSGTAGDKRLVGYVVADPEPSAAALREALLRVLPDHMVPAAYVPLAALPLTSTGKVDRDALPAPEGPREAAPGFVAPSGPIEEKLAALWREALHVEQVGATDDFFDLGGHSLILFQLAAQIDRDFGVELPVHVLFDTSTIRDMALAIVERLADADDLLGEIEALTTAEAEEALKRDP